MPRDRRGSQSADLDPLRAVVRDACKRITRSGDRLEDYALAQAFEWRQPAQQRAAPLEELADLKGRAQQLKTERRRIESEAEGLRSAAERLFKLLS